MGHSICLALCTLWCICYLNDTFDDCTSKLIQCLNKLVCTIQCNSTLKHCGNSFASSPILLVVTYSHVLCSLSLTIKKAPPHSQFFSQIHKLPLVAFRCSENLGDIMVKSSLLTNTQTHTLKRSFKNNKRVLHRTPSLTDKLPYTVITLFQLLDTNPPLKGLLECSMICCSLTP